MAISSAGIGSGLDVEKIVTKLVELEKSPLKTLETKAEGIKTQISTYGEIKSLTSKLNDIVSKLSRDGAWSNVSISSSNSALAGTMTGIAATGTFNIKVNGLAQAQTSLIGGVADMALAKDTAMGATGKLNLEIGGKTHSIEIGAADTLAKIAAKVNEAGAGVQATVVTNADGSERLMLRSKETGTEQAFSATIVPDADAGVDSPLSTLSVSEAQPAKDAKITLNGVEVESGSNTFASTIPGMSFTVSEVTSQPVVLSVKADTEGMKKNIQEFVDAYNALNDLMSASTKYDSDSKAAGVLQGDSSTVSLQNALRMLTAGFSGSQGAFTRLADIGIQMQQGGKLTVDDTKLTQGLAKVEDLKALFANKTDSLGEGGGIAVNFKNFTDKLLAYEGTLNGKTDSLEKTLKNNAKDQDKVNARAGTLETRLYKQYSTLDVKMSSLNALNSYVSQMVTTWNKSSD